MPHEAALWQEGGLSDYSDAEALGVMKRILEIKRIVTGEDSPEAGDSRALVPVPQPGMERRLSVTRLTAKDACPPRDLSIRRGCAPSLCCLPTALRRHAVHAIVLRRSC